jgi:hypothetical protein
LAAAAVALSVAAQESARPARFAYERPIVTAGAGAQRLAVDVPLVAAGAPFTIVPRPDGLAAAGGLADLRLFDGGGREVPYLLVPAPPSAPDWIGGVVLPVAITEKTSGFEADIGSVETVDAMRVEGLPAPFLKRLVLEGSGDRSHWTMLDPEGTLFDLPDERLRRLEIEFRRGAYRYLRVTWDDTNSGRLPMPRLASARRVSASAPPPVRTRALDAERRPSEPGRSRYRLRLPGARLPIVALQIDVGGSGPLLRQAVVTESRLTGGEVAPATLGRATLRRAVRGGASASELRVPIERPTEAELDLAIEDGNNPPLDLTSVSAVFAELPWIYFEAPDGSLVARYGDASAKAPSYDLEAVRESVKINALPEAQWGEPRPLVRNSSASPPPDIPAIGAPVDAAAFRFARPIPDGPAGLVALPLDAAALAHSGGPVTRFSDVRIIEPGGRQVPYLVERRDEPLSLDLALEPVTAEVSPSVRSGRNRTAYRVTLPYVGLPGASVVLDTSARVFQRAVRLGVERPPDRRHRDARYEVFAHRVWQHADQQAAAPALMLQVPSLDVTELILMVDEGDNSALPITAARLLLPSYRLRFYRPAASGVRLAYGRTDLAPPRYDLALLAMQVLGAETREVAADPESGAAAAAAQTLVSPRVFWGLLSLAIVVLLAMIGRLVATSSAPPSS